LQLTCAIGFSPLSRLANDQRHIGSPDLIEGHGARLEPATPSPLPIHPSFFVFHPLNVSHGQSVLCLCAFVAFLSSDGFSVLARSFGAKIVCVIFTVFAQYNCPAVRVRDAWIDLTSLFTFTTLGEMRDVSGVKTGLAQGVTSFPKGRFYLQ
jgi:hypothetical protein